MTSQNPSAAAGTAQKPRLLFVDDEPNILNSMRWLFRREYDVTLANSGQEAIDLIKKHPFHVVCSDQRMPGVGGVEVLSAARELQPNAMRLLLTGYADLKAIVGSVNEGEVFRFVTKPWVNDELKAVVKLAAETAMTAPASQPQEKAAEPPPAAVAAPGSPEVLVLDADPAVKDMVAETLQANYIVHGATTLDAALELLEKHDIQVVVSETRLGALDITGLVKLLKKHHPDIVSVVLTEHTDAETVIQLINQGQVYRFMQKPVRPGLCRLSIQSAVTHSVRLRAHPELIKRHAVEDVDEQALLAAARRGGREGDGNLFGRLMGRVSKLKRLFFS